MRKVESGLTLWLTLLLVGAIVALAFGVGAGQQEAAADTSFTNVIFLHHSTGGNLIEEGDVREGLTARGYSFWDHGYNGEGLRLPDGGYAGYNYNIPDDNTDPDGFYVIFNQPLLPDAGHPNVPPNAFTGLMRHDVILFKSCFPASDIWDDAQLENYKTYYRSIRERADQHLDHIFIAFSTPPLHPCATAPDRAARARAFANWLKSNEYLAGHPNLFCFDFFNLLAESDPARPDYNMLRAAYRPAGCDSHPNTLANQTIGPILVNFVDQAVQTYRGGTGNAPQTVRAVAPARGWSRPGAFVSFTSVYRDADGWRDMRYADLLVNNAARYNRGAYLRYDLQANRMFLRHPWFGYWQPPTGGEPGSSEVLTNSHVRLDLSRSCVVTDTDTLTITWGVTFTFNMSGRSHNLYLYVQDVGGRSDGWDDHGDWIVNRQPGLLSITPNEQTLVSGQRYLLEARYLDRDGGDTFEDVYLAITNTLPGRMAGGVYLRYNQRENRFYLRNADDTAWLPAGGIPPRTPTIVQNDVCILYGEWTRWGRFNAQTLTAKWYVAFKPAFAGRHNIYMRAVDRFGAEHGGDTGWRCKSWIRIN